ncbi:MAG: hypothetical protein ACJ79S_17945 [Gemmatimonadaceae bacterium]
MPLPSNRGYRTSGPRPAVDPDVPFELRDVTRGLIEALQRVLPTAATPADVRGVRIAEGLRFALRRYTTRARAVGRSEEEVTREVAAMAAVHASRALPERQRTELVAAVAATVSYDFVN